jgi:hypothetical protein
MTRIWYRYVTGKGHYPIGVEDYAAFVNAVENGTWTKVSLLVAPPDENPEWMVNGKYVMEYSAVKK